MNIRSPLPHVLLLILSFSFLQSCAKEAPLATQPDLPTPTAENITPALPSPRSAPVTVDPDPIVQPELIVEDSLGSRSLEELNRDIPLEIVFFEYDSDEIGESGQAALQANAELLQQNLNWIVTIEGHCDERGTAEYNLSLGERRALSARNYLLSLGIAPERLRTVSYGKEFPFDPEQNEESWARNRRAHFIITAN